MTKKPTCEELEQRIKELEEEVALRTRTEQAPRESEERYRTIFELAADSIVLIVGETGELVEFNRRAHEDLGFTHEEFEKLKIPDFEVVEDAEKVAKHIKKIIKEGSDSFETKHRTKSGEIRNVQVSSRAISIRGKNFVQSIWRNITEQKRAEEALHKSELEMRMRNRIAQIFLTIPDEEMYGEVLQVVLEALESRYGIFGFIDEHGTLVIPSMTRDIWEQCQVPDKTILYPRETWGGIWGQSLIEKRSLYANEGLRVPEGHLPIISVLVVPIKYGGEVIGLFEVANKATGYDEKDKAFLETIAEHISPVLNARLQRDRQEKDRNKAQQALKEAHDELERRVQERTAKLRRVSSLLLDVQENARKRIAGELHDSIGQSLTAIKFGLENVISSISQDAVEESIELLEALIPVVQQASEEVRQIHTDLRPSLLDDLGIISTISWFCREFEKVYSGIKIEKQVNMEEKEIPEPLKIVIFRVLQEALNNISKYGKANHVRISLKGITGKLEFIVEDNGLGFDIEHMRYVKSSKRGLGLTSMKERIELSGGAFAIESTPGVGTVVRASWPI